MKHRQFLFSYSPSSSPFTTTTFKSTLCEYTLNPSTHIAFQGSSPKIPFLDDLLRLIGGVEDVSSSEEEKRGASLYHATHVSQICWGGVWGKGAGWRYLHLTIPIKVVVDEFFEGRDGGVGVGVVGVGEGRDGGFVGGGDCEF